MIIDDKKVRIAIWMTCLPSAKGALIGILLVGVFAFAILHKTPIGPTKEVVAQVEAIGVTHGATGGGRYIVCILDDGEQTRVFLDNPAPLIQKGQTVKLRESSRLFGRKAYQLSSPNAYDG